MINPAFPPYGVVDAGDIATAVSDEATARDVAIGVEATARDAAIALLIMSGTGTPEAVVTAPVGTLFIRTDGGASTTLYVKETGAGNTGWAAK